MKSILKKINSKLILLFLCVFFSITAQAQWGEDGGNDDSDGDGWPDWVEDAWDKTPDGQNTTWVYDDDGNTTQNFDDIDSFGGMDDDQISNLYSILNGSEASAFLLNGVTVDSATNFDHSQFMTDVLKSYNDSLQTNGLMGNPYSNYYSSGDYGPDTDPNHALIAAGIVALPALLAEGSLVYLGNLAWAETVAVLKQATIGMAIRNMIASTLSQMMANGWDINKVNLIAVGLSSIPSYGTVVVGQTIPYSFADGLQIPTFKQWVVAAGSSVVTNYFGNATDGYLKGEGLGGALIGEYFKVLVSSAGNAVSNTGN